MDEQLNIPAYPPSDSKQAPPRPENTAPEPALGPSRTESKSVEVPTPQISNTNPTAIPVLSIWRALQTILSMGIIVATLFTMWTPANLFSNELLDKMLEAVQNQDQQNPVPVNFPTPTAPPHLPIGIVSGHWQNDSGAVCPDGLTEMDVNLRIATLVRQKLIEKGYQVDLLAEFDKRLNQYQAMALISIHNDSCNYINNEATGFKVAAAMSNLHPEKAERLKACLIHRYQSITNMKYHPTTITVDMTSYHAFEEVNEKTTAAIIETGFLNLDRQILTQQPDLIAQAITAGILCYIENEPVPADALPTMPAPPPAQ